MEYLYCSTFGETPEDGINLIKLVNASETALIEVKQAAMLKNLEYMTGTKDGYLYAAGRYGPDRSYIQSFRIDRENGLLDSVDCRTFDWKGISYMSVDSKEEHLLAAAYGSGRITAVGISGGKIGSQTADIAFDGCGPVETRQEHSHPHFIECTGGICYMADLGGDAWYYIEENGLAADSAWHRMEERPGSGPRNMAFHPSKEILYLLAELSNELVVYGKSENNRWKAMQRICLDCAGVKDSLASVLQITPDGDRLYAGVRGLNQIKEFIVEPEGTLREARLFTSCGWPRSFLYREENALLIVNEEYGDSKGALELWDLKTGHRSGYRALSGAMQIYRIVLP